MATGTIKKQGLCTWATNISFPYNATSDGFIVARANPSSNSSWYCQITIDDDGIYKRLQLAGTTGVGTSGTIPIKSGSNAVLAVSNCGVFASFVPLL